MNLRPSNYSRFSIPTGMDALRRYYASWILGKGDFRHLRDRRVACGIPPAAAIDDLLGEHDVVWTPTIGVRARDAGSRQWVTHFWHADARVAGTTWHNFVRLSRDDPNNTVVVEHLVGRVLQDDSHVRLIAAPPTATIKLVEQYRTQVRPKELFSATARRVDAGDINRFASHILLDETRDVTVVVVSAASATNEPSVDANGIAKALAGMASVYVLESAGASRRLTDELGARGLDPKLGVYDGAVRIYRPQLRERPELDRHPLLFRKWIERARGRACVQRTSGRIVELIALEYIAPNSWLSFIDHLDQSKRRLAVLATIEIQPSPSQAESEGPRGTQPVREVAERPNADQQVAALRQQVAALQKQLKEATELERLALEENEQLTRQRDDALRARDEARDRAETMQTERDHLIMVKSIADAVELATHVYETDLVIVDSARKSAARSPYRNPRRVFEVLGRLALSTRQQRSCFGDVLKETMGKQARYSPKDSPETMRKFGAERKFRSLSGTMKEYQRHVTIGGTDDPKRHCQIYFDDLPDGRVEVVHVGLHLKTVSGNT